MPGEGPACGQLSGNAVVVVSRTEVSRAGVPLTERPVKAPASGHLSSNAVAAVSRTEASKAGVRLAGTLERPANRDVLASIDLHQMTVEEVKCAGVLVLRHPPWSPGFACSVLSSDPMASKSRSALSLAIIWSSHCTTNWIGVVIV